MIYKCTYFDIWELVDKETYKIRGEKAWQLFDPNLLKLADFLREKFGPMICNDWMNGGGNQWRGLRTSESSYYSTYSQHSLGNALDLISTQHSADYIRSWLKANWKELGLGFPITIEEDVSWLHVDTRQADYMVNTFRV
jgi:hypothetical protein